MTCVCVCGEGGARRQLATRDEERYAHAQRAKRIIIDRACGVLIIVGVGVSLTRVTDMRSSAARAARVHFLDYREKHISASIVRGPIGVYACQ